MDPAEGNLTRQFRTFAVDAARLAPGRWQENTQRWKDEGDIHASYSADRIASGQPIRKPFSWQGGL